MPERSLAVTIRAYAEHLQELRPILEDVLSDPAFKHDARVRYLLLEGRRAFEQRFSSKSDRAWLDRFIADHPVEKARRDALAQLLARDGIKHAIRERPLDPATAGILDAALQEHFGRLAPTQGLRFRSSSTVEDVEGFSGAGLYDSNTGFLDPAAQASKKDRKREVAWAIKKTWASYWSWEAFEERRMAGIDHLAGNMAVLVHPRFDDALELSNGVLTLTLDRGQGTTQGGAQAYASMELDVQLGALSVTNPPPERAGEVLPEVVRVRLAAPGSAVEIARVAQSTELPEGRAAILDDAQIEAVFRASLASAERFLAVENLGLDPARARRRVTLDIEFREVAEGWPAAKNGPPAPPRIVLKQLRSLDPGIPPGAEPLLDQPIPRELLLFADRIEKRSCRATRTRVDLIEVWTDPMATPDLGHGQLPFVVRARVQARGLIGGPVTLDLDHLGVRSVAHPGMDRGQPWALTLGVDPGPAASNGAGLDTLEFTNGLLRLRAGSTLLGSEPSSCTTELLFASPDGFLRGLIGR